jgi:hypothetical protein
MPSRGLSPLFTDDDMDYSSDKAEEEDKGYPIPSLREALRMPRVDVLCLLDEEGSEKEELAEGDW